MKAPVFSFDGLRLSFAARAFLESMRPALTNKITAISHRSFGFRNASNFIAAIYH